MIKILGQLKGINLKSKAVEGEEIHTIEIKLELSDGQNRVQEIISLLKNIVEVSLDSRQPELGIPARLNSDNDDLND